MFVIAGNIKMTGTVGKKQETKEVTLPLPLFDYDIRELIKSKMPKASEGTIESYLSMVGWKNANNEILLEKR